MQPSRGYKEAKRLLHKHYGDELRIASAYIDKALQWPQIKSEDGKALNAYAMFLVGCRNTMEDIESLEEMDNPTNLRTVVSKLPYKMKERWRAEAYNIKERRDRRAKFTDLVSYIERQAKIATDPLFGDIPDSRPTSAGKNDKERPPAKKEKRGSFATNVSTENQKIKWAGEKSANPNKKGSAFEKPSTFITEDLRKKLNVKGKPTQILLSTMNQDRPGGQKPMNSYVISDLEVCGLEDSKFIELPKAYTHGSIPVHTENIPKQSEIRKWPYLSEVACQR
ncbi:hypothetical protein AAFF_G00239300 [Aldrovandia affinis]|uniref:Uncharacterized protein n=1 Tax=Aldrovandia affinis TaxID=143900 RepID=A0AAD7RDU5_9TELE|nr:hypothetical protein AAFF_G00239300 [Aldrovandia affinis]